MPRTLQPGRESKFMAPNKNYETSSKTQDPARVHCSCQSEAGQDREDKRINSLPLYNCSAL